MKCCNCGNKDLIIPNKESKLIKNGKYAACTGCGNIMMLVHDKIIPTPTTDSPLTKALIQDSANCFESGMGSPIASLNGEDINVDMQPTQTKDLIAEYVMKQFELLNECTCNEDTEDHIDEDTDTLNDCCGNCQGACSECDEDEFEELNEFIDNIDDEEPLTIEFDNKVSMDMVESNYNEKSNYVLIFPDGERQFYMNSSKDFVLEVMNSLNTKVRLFELNEINLQTKIKYTF